MPEISVVMSVYNNAEDLNASVNSILSQEGVDLEFIVIDDGSTDGSAEILDAFAERDARMRVIHQVNTGLTKALVRGCAEAGGEFIARQDADDVSLPGRLLLQVTMLRNNPELGFISSWTEWVGPEGELLFVEKRESNPEVATHELLYEKMGPSAHGSVMLRRSAYNTSGGYRPEFYFSQDVDLWLRLGHIAQLGYVKQPLYRYRVSFSSISGSRGGLQSDYDRLAHACHQARLHGESEKMLLREAAGLRNSGQRRKSSSESATAYFIGRCLLARGDCRAASYFQKVIGRSPLNLRAWFSYMQSLMLPRNG